MISTAAAAAVESLAARTRALLLWAAVAQASAVLKAQDLADLADPEGLVALVVPVVLHLDLVAGKESQPASKGWLEKIIVNEPFQLQRPPIGDYCTGRAGCVMSKRYRVYMRRRVMARG